MSDKLERITPMEAGIEPQAILGFLDQIEQKKVHLHNFMMMKGDKVFAQGSYAPCKLEDRHTLFSLSKSFTSVAVGFAVQEGLLCLEDKVVNFFTKELDGNNKICENMKKVTIRNLLTMNTGQTDPEDDLFQKMDVDWAMSFLTSSVEKEPGRWFLYNTRATYMLSVILQKVTGQKLFAYLKPRLFEPLGFSKDIWWECSPQGYNTGGFGLNVTVEDIAKFGIFLKDKGNFGGRQLLAEKWLEEAVKPWSDSSNTWSGENLYGYGFQFWMCHIPGSYRADGAFGQYCVILPERDMVFVTTAGELDMQQILDAFWEHIYKETSKERKATSSLEERIAGLHVPTYYEEKGVRESMIRIPAEAWGKEYLLEDNILQIKALRFWPDVSMKKCTLEMKNGNNWNTIIVSAFDWIPAEILVDGNSTSLAKYSFRSGLFEKSYIKGCTKGNVFYMDMLFHETSFQDTWEIAFEEECITVKVKRNTGFEAVDFKVMGVKKGE